MKRQIIWLITIVMIVYVCIVAGGIYLYNDLFPKAKPMEMPKTEAVESIWLSYNTTSMSIPMSIMDWEKLCECISEAEPTRIQAYNENPTVKLYYCIDIQTTDRPYRYFIYEDDHQIYVEVPYVGIYETDIEALNCVLSYFQED